MEYDEIKEKMSKALEVLEQRLAEIRAGRANPAILNKVKIDYYGTPTPINQVAGISVPEARLIVIQPWDASILKEIERAILAAAVTNKSFTYGANQRLAFICGQSDVKIKQVGALANDAYTGQEIIGDDRLMKLEEEAYLKGNILFRSWTESIQNEIASEPTEHMRKLIKLNEEQMEQIIKIK